MADGEIVVKNIMPDHSGSDGFGGMGGIGGILIGSLLGGRGGLFGGNAWGGGVGWPAAAAVATDIVLNPALASIQSQIGSLQDQISDNGLSNEIGRVQDQISAQATGISASIANLATAQAAWNFTTLQSINGLGRDVTAQANQNALQQLNSFNNMTTTTLQGFNSQAMQTQNATNQIIAQWTALAAQLATCCCNLENAIHSDGDATRALINANRMDDLQTALNEARLAASQSQQTAAIVASLKGTSVVV